MSFHLFTAAQIIREYNPALAALFLSQPANRWTVAKAIKAVAGDSVYAMIAARIEMHHAMGEAL